MLTSPLNLTNHLPNGRVAEKAIKPSEHPGRPEPMQGQGPACAFIGEGSLLVECVRAALAAGFRVTRVISQDARVRGFAREENISLGDHYSALPEAMEQTPIQFLFSIVNHQILPAALLSSVDGLTINYHDGPLPKYAGLHATSWALLNGETEHGITWHQVDARIDTGNILKQKKVPIGPEDTALTLNVKCYEAALQSFAELLEELLRGKLQPQPQATGQRTYFSGKKRPAGAGLLLFSQPAAQIDRLCRALHLGNHTNLLGLPKILLGGDPFLVAGLCLPGTVSSAEPGTITRIDGREIHIAALDQEITLTGLLSLSGQPQELASVVTRLGLAAGQRCPEPTAEQLIRIENQDAALSAFQRYWAGKLSAFQPLPVPFSHRIPVPPPFPYRVIRREFKAGDAGMGKDNPRLLATAFTLFLSRITGSAAVHFGFTTDDLRKTRQNLPPIFADQVPFAIGLTDNDTAETVSEAVENEWKAVEKNQTYLLDLVARIPALRNRPELQAGASFPVSLILSDTLHPLPAFSGELALVIGTGTSEYAWMGDASRLDEEAMHRIASHFETLLASMLREPQLPTKALPLLPAAERERILFSWNQTYADYDRSGCLHRLFERQAQQSPDAVAVLFEGKSLTYRELNERANRLAHHLQTLGVGPEVLVGISMEKSLEMIIGVMAILKAGGAYVPLDAYAPKDRLALLLDDLQLGVLLTQNAFAPRFDAPSLRVLALDPDTDFLLSYPVTNPVSAVTAENLAYIIYTSGSTGVPKGVMVRHRPVINLIEWITKTFSIGADDRVLFVNSLGFDLSVYDIFGLLAAGGAVRIASRRELQEPQLLLDILCQEPITFWDSAPATLSQLIPFHRPEWAPAKSSLRLAFLSGDWIPLTMPGWVQTAFPGTEVVSLGGATEATVWSNFFRIGELDPQWVSIPYGRPIPNARYHILDSRLAPVPVGVTGELFIGGECLADGYFKRPELNAAKFIPDPFSDNPADRLYHTGDLARYRADGNIEFLGRLDHQVKIRGYRVEMGEIEAVLSQRDDLQEVLVIAGPDPAGGKRLIAYLVAKPGVPVAPAELRQYLKDKLPEYMIPAAFVRLEAFPLNASGKIDRKALPEPGTQTESALPYEAPHSATEKRLSLIWAKHLGREQVGVNDHFFELGGHSLLAGRVISEIHAQTGRLLPLSMIFANPTIRQLAPLVKEEKESEAWPTLVPIRTTGTRPPLFCFHPISGDIEYAYKLAQYLSPDQPVYGILAKGINGQEEPFDNISEAAAAYLEHLLEQNPEGPFLLAGYSYGGFVAYEVAQRLTRMGKKVEHLVLFDTYPTNVGRQYRSYALEYVMMSTMNLLISPKNLHDFYRNEYWRSAVRKLKSLLKLLASQAGFRKFEPVVQPAGSADADQHRDLIQSALMYRLAKSSDTYKVTPYPGKLIFIRAVEGAARYLHNSDFGWKKKALGGVKVYDVFGVDHLKLFEKDAHVQEVARYLNEHLDPHNPCTPG